MRNKFDLFGTTWKIEYVDSLTSDEGNPLYGITSSANRTIKIAKNLDNIKQSKEEMEITLYHELFHAMLGTGQYLNCNNDEPLVEWLARCLSSIKKQGII